MMDNKLQVGDLVGIVCCSDGRETSNRDIIEKTIRIFHDAGFQTLVSPYIYRIKGLESGTPKERAEALMNMYQNSSVKAIFDIGGGDLAIQLLEYLDFRIIRESGKEFWGYSDLTTIITSIYQKTGNSSWLYQARKLAEEGGEAFISYFNQVTKGQLPSSWCGLSPQEIKFLQGNHMEGILLGGNIRCLLKLAGTEFFPDLNGKLLFLESLEGGAGIVTAWLTQLKLMGVFKKINGLILGTYTELDHANGSTMIETLVHEIVNDPTLPVARTMRVGHDVGSYALHIGVPYCLQK